MTEHANENGWTKAGIKAQLASRCPERTRRSCGRGFSLAGLRRASNMATSGGAAEMLYRPKDQRRQWNCGGTARKPTFKCDNAACGKLFTRYLSSAAGNHHYCSSPCANARDVPPTPNNGT